MGLEQLERSQPDLRVSRRSFLVVLGTGALVLAGCSSPKPTPAPQVTTIDASSFIEGAIVPGAKDRLIQEVNALPESPIKRALIERVLPYYQQQAPFVLNRSGLEITVHSASITARKTRKAQSDGTFVFHQLNAPEDKFYAVETTKIMVPFPNIIKKSNNKTLFIDYNIAAGAYIPAGVYPKITVTTPYFNLLSPSDRDFHANLEPFAYIKEACSLLFADVMLEEIYKMATELGLPVTVSVRDSQGNTKDKEVVTALWNTLFDSSNKNSTGRTVAAVDIAGYLIALKAIESTGMVAKFNRDSNFVSALRLLPSLDLGNTPHDIWERSLDLAISNLDIQKLPHVGSIDRIP